MRKQFWLYVLVVCGLTVYTVYDLKYGDGSEQEGEVNLFNIRADQIEQIVLNFEGPTSGRKISLKKSGGKWQLQSPVVDDAEQVAVESLLMTTFGERGSKVGDEGDGNRGSVDWQAYGLASPLLTIDMLGGGRKESLAISSTNAFDGSFYLRSKDLLLLGSKNWSRLVEQTATSFRQRKVIPAFGEVAGVTVSMDTADYKGRYGLVRTAEGWHFVPSLGFSVESIKVDRWLEEVQDIRVNEFVSEEMPKEMSSRLQLDQPSLVLSIKNKSGKLWNLKFSPDRGQEVFLKTDFKPTVYSIGNGLLKTIRVSPDYFRDGKVPLQFSLEQAQRIVVSGNGRELDIRKGDGQWGIVAIDGSPLSLDQEKLILFLQRLKTLEAVDFPKKMGGGFAKPTLSVQNGKGDLLLEIAIGGSYRPTAGAHIGEKLSYVRVTGQQQVLGLKSEQLEFLQTHDFLEKKTNENN